MRVAILALLCSGEKDFSSLKAILHATDGNLSVQLSNLENSGCICVRKQPVEKKKNSTYIITRDGKRLITDYLEMLNRMVQADPDSGEEGKSRYEKKPVSNRTAVMCDAAMPD